MTNSTRISNTGHRYITKLNKNYNCKTYQYYKLFNRNKKEWAIKTFRNLTDALCYKYIIQLKLKAGLNCITPKRNTWS